MVAKNQSLVVGSVALLSYTPQNGLSPIRRQTIIQPNSGLLLIGP